MSGCKKGTKFTEEHKKRISLALTGRKKPPFSAEWIEKLRIASTGRKHSDMAKAKISKALKGKPKSMEHKRKLAEYKGEKASWYGRKHSIEERIKMHSNQPRQSNHYNWQGGVSKLLRQIKSLFEAKEWRIQVFKRDDYTCQECFHKGGILNAHHKKPFFELFYEFLNQYSQFSPIDDVETLIRLAINHKLFWDIDNGITLCKSCHEKTVNYKKKILEYRRTYGKGNSI